MDNNKQAVDIKGYRVLSDEEKKCINELKAAEKEILDKLNAMNQMEGTNKRSMALGITNIQTGFMWAIRAIARPNGE